MYLLAEERWERYFQIEKVFRINCQGGSLLTAYPQKRFSTSVRIKKKPTQLTWPLESNENVFIDLEKKGSKTIQEISWKAG